MTKNKKILVFLIKKKFYLYKKKKNCRCILISRHYCILKVYIRLSLSVT